LQTSLYTSAHIQVDWRLVEDRLLSNSPVTREALQEYLLVLPVAKGLAHL